MARVRFPARSTPRAADAAPSCGRFDALGMRGGEADAETPLSRHAAVAVVLVTLVLLFSASTIHSQVAVSIGKGTVGTGSGASQASAELETALVPDPEGDPDLSGSADLVVNVRRGTVCFDIDLDETTPGADSVVAVHIHPGSAAETCDAQDCAPALDLDFANQGLRGCARAGKFLLGVLADEPEQFYLHVHTARFPAGAVRGQLAED
jgi:hypothetical protein